jgi:hypothetical protein
MKFLLFVASALDAARIVAEQYGWPSASRSMDRAAVS